ncbi:hypothetical protein PIB30_034619 [Stylosanthes scabra]|uniref:Uncharacterized protein n=1 Tax=Stylosanthes scabra TaxID=79078 RepID=A0ABU6XAJ8_9FABA|nr:hypothetical protein [Stylosanthes scabra]
MPIYHDYHGGDSNSSSIYTWDQIQISLKYLLLSYQPILSDSTVVASFLSDQPPKQICADFEQNSVSEFQEQESEAEIQAKSESTFQILNISSTNQEEWNSANSDDQKQEDEDEDVLDARRIYRGLEDRNEAVVGHRPPPESPDMNTPTEELFPIQTPACRNKTEVAENECGIHSGAEDGAVAKGKAGTESYTARREMPASNGAEDFADKGTESSAEVSASAKGKWTGAIATVSDGGLRARLLRRFFLLTPPPLLATTTIFPWDRVEVKMRERETVTCVAIVEDGFARKGTSDVGLAVMAASLWDGTAPRRASVEVVGGCWNERERVTTLDDLMGLSRCWLLTIQEAQMIRFCFWTLSCKSFVQILMISIHGPNQFCLLFVDGQQFYQWDPGGAL